MRLLLTSPAVVFLYLGLATSAPICCKLSICTSLEQIPSDCTIVGELRLSGTSVKSLAGLARVRSIETFVLQGTALSSFAGVQTLAVNNLSVLDNAQLLSLGGGQVLVALFNVMPDRVQTLVVRNNSRLRTLDGVAFLPDPLTWDGFDSVLHVVGNAALTSLGGLIDRLPPQWLGWGFNFLAVEDNAALASLGNLTNLAYVQTLILRGNGQLRDLRGLEFVRVGDVSFPTMKLVLESNSLMSIDHFAAMNSHAIHQACRVTVNEVALCCPSDAFFDRTGITRRDVPCRICL